MIALILVAFIFLFIGLFIGAANNTGVRKIADSVSSLAKSAEALVAHHKQTSPSAGAVNKG